MKTSALKLSNIRQQSRLALLLLLLFVLFAFALFSYTQTQLLTRSAQQPWVRLIFLGEPLTLSQEDIKSFKNDLAVLTKAQDAALDAQLQYWLAETSQQMRQSAESGVDEYLDWYFSLPGSYMRLFAALSGDLDELLMQRLEERLLQDSQLHTSWRDSMAGIGSQVTASWQAQAQGEGHARAQALREEYQQRQEPGLQVLADDDSRVQLLATDWSVHLTPDLSDLRRWQISAGSGGLAGAAIALPSGRLLASRLVTTPAMVAGSQVVRRYLARLPARLALQTAASGQTLMATAPSGPGALVAGGSVFAVMTAADWGLLKVEEARHRESMRAGLLDEFATHFQQVAQQRLDNQLASYRQGRQQESFYILNRE